MKLLFLHPNNADYLSATLFHGLRTLLGNNCVDFPRYDIMYKNFPQSLKTTIRGNAFTLYGLLEEETNEVKVDRNKCLDNLNKFDKIIVSNIWWIEYSLIRFLINNVSKNKIIIIDGADQSAVFPFGSFYNRLKNDFFSYFFSSNDFKYFKRELDENSYYNLLGHILKSTTSLSFKIKRNLLPIHFAIPKEKINYVTVENKKKMFNTQIVDEEIAIKIQDSKFSSLGSDLIIFREESDYYKDLQESKFGITTKRAGWDCLRHYELAANGAVLCFKNLYDKFDISAPIGLNSKNCIIYNNYDDLVAQINNISNDTYETLLNATYKWIENNTTEKLAEYVIQNC